MSKGYMAVPAFHPTGRSIGSLRAWLLELDSQNSHPHGAILLAVYGLWKNIKRTLVFSSIK